MPIFLLCEAYFIGLLCLLCVLCTFQINKWASLYTLEGIALTPSNNFGRSLKLEDNPLTIGSVAPWDVWVIDTISCLPSNRQTSVSALFELWLMLTPLDRKRLKERERLKEPAGWHDSEKSDGLSHQLSFGDQIWE